MRAVVQRVREASVSVDGKETGRIGAGLAVFLGIGRGDGEKEIEYLSEKIVSLRIFEDESSHFNRSLPQVGGEILLVSQFTLYGDCTRGRRPSFDLAAPPIEAENLYRQFADHLRSKGFPPREGIFGAKMMVSLVNDGPVTILLDTERRS